MKRGKEEREILKIISDIKSIKVQGATNVAKAALKAYGLFSNKKSKKKLLSLRPTEPMLENVLDLAEKGIPEKRDRTDSFEIRCQPAGKRDEEQNRQQSGSCTWGPSYKRDSTREK